MPGSSWIDMATEAASSAMELVTELAAHNWKEAVSQTIDRARVVRVDYVDFKFEPVSALRFLSMTNLSPPFHGVLYATRDHTIGWIRETLSDPGWEQYEIPLSAVSDVHIPLGEARMNAISSVSPTSLRLNAGGKRAFVMFTGIIPERFETSRLDKVLGKLHAFHGQPIGMYYMIAKYLYQQRGSLGRSRAALSFWSRLFRGELSLESYDLALLKRLRDMGSDQSRPTPASVGHLANVLTIEVEDADFKSAAGDRALQLMRSRFEAQALLEAIMSPAGDTEDEPTASDIQSEVSACEALIGRFKDSTDPWLKGVVAIAGLYLGMALMARDDFEAALQQFDVILDEAGVQKAWVPARARYDRARTLILMDRNLEALSELQRLLNDTAGGDDPDVAYIRSEAEALRDRFRPN